MSNKAVMRNFKSKFCGYNIFSIFGHFCCKVRKKSSTLYLDKILHSEMYSEKWDQISKTLNVVKVY